VVRWRGLDFCRPLRHRQRGAGQNYAKKTSHYRRREWDVLHIKLERTSTGETRIVVTNLASKVLAAFILSPA
jgi:hypothetical protein